MTAGRKPADAKAIKAWRTHKPRQLKALAERLGISIPAVSKWKQVPLDRLDGVAEHLSVSRGELRPDLYPPDPWAPLHQNKDQ